MDTNYKHLFKQALGDRPYLAVMVAIVVVALLFIVYTLLTIEARDIQVATRYSSFGEANYYRGKWFSLYGFSLLAAGIAVGHNMLMLKFLSLNRRSIGILFGLVSILILVIGWLYAANIIGQIAFI